MISSRSANSARCSRSEQCSPSRIKAAGSREAFHRVDCVYPAALAEAAHAAGCARFLLVTAVGASSKSRIFYNRVKGEVEAAVSAIDFAGGVKIIRPSMLLGERQEARRGEAVGQVLFGWTRNHYDRLVHFGYGLLIAYPAYELLERYASPAGAWSYVLSPALIMATSAAFEVIEWWAAELLGGPAGSDYVGAQGDPWDAQKDMALATVGAVIAMVATVILS